VPLYENLKRDATKMDHHRALGCCLRMIFSENRCAPDHALAELIAVNSDMPVSA
jgi:hypothetical protein